MLDVLADEKADVADEKRDDGEYGCSAMQGMA